MEKAFLRFIDHRDAASIRKAGRSRERQLRHQHRLDRRCQVAEETFRLAKMYRSAARTEVLEGPFMPGAPALFGETFIEVTAEESLEAAERLAQLYASEFKRRRQRSACGIAVLNAANDHMSPAELPLALAVDNEAEVELCRRSTLVSELAEMDYPLAGRLLYSPDIVALRTNRRGGYGMIPPEKALHIAVISACPFTVDEGFPQFRKRIQDILVHCSKRQHRWLVVPLWGCGLNCPYTPEEVIDLFSEDIRGKDLRGKFHHVVFAHPAIQAPGTD